MWDPVSGIAFKQKPKSVEALVLENAKAQTVSPSGAEL